MLELGITRILPYWALTVLKYNFLGKLHFFVNVKLLSMLLEKAY